MPDPANDGLVAVTMLGTVGPRHLARPVVAFLNHDPRPVKRVDYRYEYIDAEGNVLETGQYGHSGSDPIMESGRGCAVAGGKRPPGGTASARVTLTRVDFVDEIGAHRTGG